MMKFKKGDSVIIISGKDRSKKGKISKVFPKQDLVLIDGLNLRKKHVKPKKSGEKGETVQIAFPISSSNVKLICPKCGQATRVGHKLVAKNKFRVCKKCHQEI